MIDKSHRFHGHGSLRFVYQKGQTVRGQFGSLKYAPNCRRNTYRAAVVVSRKVHKSAVVRNRIRRRIYEIIRQEVSPNNEPFDLVFTVFNESAATAEHETLKNAVTTQLRDAGACRGIVEGKESII